MPLPFYKIIKNHLIDDKYYKQVSNIIKVVDDIEPFLKNIYKDNEGCLHNWMGNNNDELTKFSSCCLLMRPSIIDRNLSFQNISAFYIREDVEDLEVRNNYKILDNTCKKYNIITFDNSLEDVLKSSRTIPNINVDELNIHKFGSPSITIDNVVYKRIILPHVHYYDFKDEEDVYIEVLMMLFADMEINLLQEFYTNSEYEYVIPIISKNIMTTYIGEDNIKFDSYTV